MKRRMCGRSLCVWLSQHCRQHWPLSPPRAAWATGHSKLKIEGCDWARAEGLARRPEGESQPSLLELCRADVTRDSPLSHLLFCHLVALTNLKCTSRHSGGRVFLFPLPSNWKASQPLQSVYFCSPPFVSITKIVSDISSYHHRGLQRYKKSHYANTPEWLII